MANFPPKIIKKYKLQENKTLWFLLIVSSVFILLRIPSLVEPHWYGDEGIYQVVGRVLKSGGVLYKDVWDNKPPLLYIIYAIFNGNLFYVKLASLIVGLLSVFAFFKLTNFLYKKDIPKYLSTFIFAILFALPVIEGNIANAENFMLLPVIISAIFIFKFLEGDNKYNLVISGFLLSLALITKVVAVFDFTAFLIFIFLQKNNSINLKKIRINNIYSYFLFLISFVSLMFVVVLYFSLNNALGDFISGVFSENVSYVNVNNNFYFPLSFLLIKTLILLFALFFIFLKSRNISRSELFIYIWFVLSLYNAFFSQRPYIHYLLVILPVFSLIIGNIFELNKRRFVNIVLAFATTVLAFYHFTIYKRTIPYYRNYIDLMSSKIKIDEYFNFFDYRTPADYEVANFINASTKDSEPIFLWSNSAQIYALTNKLPIEKYVVAYHITFYEGAIKKTIDAIEKKKPRFIIQTVPDKIPRGMIANYKFKYMLEGARIYEREI